MTEPATPAALRPQRRAVEPPLVLTGRSTHRAAVTGRAPAVEVSVGGLRTIAGTISSPI